ncbi:MAG: hypothetical protein PHE53_12885 [Thermoguttaceae bacterium]|nr:hypothetical protein [Thermoguttaceae bacterium]
MRYKTITITPPTADLSGQLVRIKITADTDMGAVASSTGYDVYFTNATGTTPLPFSRLEWAITDGAASGTFDVLCDVPVAGLTLRVYYGGDSSTDKQNRNTTYAGYLLVCPLNMANAGDTAFHDFSENGNDLAYSATFRATLSANSTGIFPFGGVKNSQSISGAREASKTFACVAAMEVTSVYKMTASPNQFPLSGTSFYSMATAPNTLWFYKMSDGSVTNISLVTNGPHVINAYANGTTVNVVNARAGTATNIAIPSAGYTNVNFSIRSDTGIMSEFRVRKTQSNVASGKFLYDNLTLPTSVYTIKKPVLRRRHNRILEAF